ncbi:MAG TPA: ATP-binding cassette domain-containing protein [Clostridia bacterium]|nr:ATP-binding cassette domain-containing protein [Clostridia bacterium]
MLEISDLYQRFGERVAVDKLSLAVNAGEIVGLVGRNGAGKTTTMRAVMGILQPLGGSIRWAGHAVGLPDRLRFGYMPEERGLYPQMRVLDQVAYFARLHGLEAKAATEHAQKWITNLGLEGRELDQVVALSHGNQQRVQLAVALVHQPELLVLDEPFAGLDPSAVDSLSDVLRAEAARGTAVLFSSHQLDLVERLCRRIVILEQGRVVANGTLEELRAQVPQRLRVRVRTSADWTTALKGIDVISKDSEGALLAVGPGMDTQAVLRTAMQAGTVERFVFETGGLVELYRQLVAN